MSDPKDPISALGEAAVTLHELHGSLTDAGFSELQALYIVALIAAHSSRPAS